jgi:hypothetical protein
MESSVLARRFLFAKRAKNQFDIFFCEFNFHDYTPKLEVRAGIRSASDTALTAAELFPPM